jgi:hypothetical protein
LNLETFFKKIPPFSPNIVLAFRLLLFADFFQKLFWIKKIETHSKSFALKKFTKTQKTNSIQTRGLLFVRAFIQGISFFYSVGRWA